MPESHASPEERSGISTLESDHFMLRPLSSSARNGTRESRSSVSSWNPPQGHDSTQHLLRRTVPETSSHDSDQISNAQAEESASMATTDKEDRPGPAFPQKTCSRNDRSKSWISTIRNDWLWELGSIVVSILCTVAIAAVLLTVSDKPLSNFHLPIQPSTLISIFITTMKATMIFVVSEIISQLKWSYFETKSRQIYELQYFDGASRGPWGSVLFICFMRDRELLTTVGVIITVVAIALEPFGQQVVSLQERYVPRQGHIATIPVTHSYNTEKSGKYNTPGFNREEIESSLISGLLGSTSLLPFSCPSGNCTWPSFTSLGLCNSCKNVTKQTTLSCSMEFSLNQSSRDSARICTSSIDTDGMINNDCSSWPPLPLSPRGMININNTYKTPKNVSITIRVESYTPDPGEPLTFSVYNLANTNSTVPESLLSGSVNISESAFAQVSVSEDDIFDDGELLLDSCPQLNTTVTECQFFWCLKTYEKVHVVNGSIYTPVVHDVALNYESGGIVYEYPQYISDFFFLPENGTSDTTTNYNKTIDIGWWDMALLRNKLQGIFESYPESAVYRISQAIIFNDNVPQTITDMTENVSHRMGLASANSTLVNGTAFYPETYIVIRWCWLILPGSLVFLTIVLFVLATLQGTKRNTPLWKSCLVPFLFHGLQGWDESEISAESQKDMIQQAKSMEVRLSENENGSRMFVRVEKA
ncbi:uncharacterized protein K452DRAFT_362416 [Aplosporella prunicola CBS 121167]|uniref:Uncharacterized protein n=1 Tax=Aplosporella prunicola CBS 121167 TaxID=1176127 RepID=A0A6A6AXC8_9PEZI|nr:uncharacterized protein K452DRAFT_362416 [Aplosporella prunicola CBS 121167]KAF2136589.1 hypothetical protein K452DRAFT_362416 [Aplosporella prunicola CBS 121167]